MKPESLCLGRWTARPRRLRSCRTADNINNGRAFLGSDASIDVATGQGAKPVRKAMLSASQRANASSMSRTLTKCCHDRRGGLSQPEPPIVECETAAQVDSNGRYVLRGSGSTSDRS